MGTTEIFAARRDVATRIAEDREMLWRIALRAAVLCARAQDICRRSRWEASRARHLLRAHVLRDAVVGSPRAPWKRGRRRSAARLVAVRPVR